ncbi:MAG: helix-turn-helix transcriptional regulator [Rubrivivax sp.]|nr:helix-turn-helix transcriptional regulator [Rubrivivax sp.]
MNPSTIEFSARAPSPALRPGLTEAAGAAPAALAHWLARSLDEIDYGLVLIGEDGRVQYANQAARDAIDHHHPLHLPGGRIAAKGDDDEALLQEALAAASRRGLRRLLTLGLGEHRASVAVVPLELAPGLPSGATLLLLGRREACQRLSIEWFARTHGLTPAETRVLEALVRGDEPREIADSFAVGLATVRTQIGCIRAKVGAPSIRDLLRRVGTLPPMLSALRMN